jgi:hypothetical protein
MTLAQSGERFSLFYSMTIVRHVLYRPHLMSDVTFSSYNEAKRERQRYSILCDPTSEFRQYLQMMKCELFLAHST